MATEKRKLSSTDHPITFWMYDTDGVPVTGETVTVNLSKDGGAPGAASGAVSEIGSTGQYKLAGHATDRGTTGPLELICTSSGAETTRFTVDIVEYDPYLFPDVNLTKILGTAPTEGGAGRLAGAFTKFFDKATPTGTINSLPDAVAGATNGLFIAGTNAATTVTTSFTTTFTGNLTGSVDSVTNAVGSVTGNVGGNVTGSVGSIGGVTFPTNFADMSITATTGIVKADLETVKTQAVTCAAAVTIYPAVGMTATANGNFEIVFATDFATNYDTGVDKWNVTGGGGGDGSGFTAIPWNAAWDAEVQSEVQDAIEANHLDHLLAVTYDPASKPGAADALLNELIGDDAGVSQFTANSLELGPTGGGSDPWDVTLPGAYASGKAGNVLGNALADLATAHGAGSWATATGFSTLDAAGIRTAVGLGSANLDTQLATLQTGVNALAPASDVAGSFTQTYGTVIANTYANTATDDNSRHTLAPEAVNGLNAEYTFTLASTNVPTRVAINGYFNGTAQYAEVYAYDYETVGWVQLSNSTTRMATRSSDANYTYELSRQYVEDGTGEVKIRFVSPSTNTAHRLYLDRVLVYSLTEAGTIAGLTAANVWEYATRTITGGTIDVYTGNTPQTADVATLIATVGVAGVGLTVLATQASVNDIPTTSEAQAMFDALNQSASRRVTIITSQQWEIPESGSNTYRIQARTYDGDGALVNADLTPTLTATGGTSGSLAANLSSATNTSTGVYDWTYTLASVLTQEQVTLSVSPVIGGSTFTDVKLPVIADFTASTWTTADRTALNGIATTLGTPAGVSVSADIAAVKADTGATQTIVSSGTHGNAALKTLIDAVDAVADAILVDTAEIGAAGAGLTALATQTSVNDIATKFGGITLVKNWLAIIAGKAADAPTLAEMNATTAGATYNNVTDSNEGQVDSGVGGIVLTAGELRRFKLMINQITEGLIVADAGNTTLTFKTNITLIDLKDQACIFADDAAVENARGPRRVLAHNMTTGFVTVNRALTAVPTAGDDVFFTGLQTSST